MKILWKQNRNFLKFDPCLLNHHSIFNWRIRRYFLTYDGVVHKWRHPRRGEGRSAKRWSYSISLFSKMGDKGEGGVKDFKNWVTSFMDSPYLYEIIKLFLKYIIFFQKSSMFKNWLGCSDQWPDISGCQCNHHL